MAAEGFSTGSIFVSVVPVFKDFQKEIRKEAEKANAKVRKDGEDLAREQVKQADLTASQIAKINDRERKRAVTEEAKAAKAIADAKIKQAREANAQAIKDDEALRQAEARRLREQLQAESKAARAREAATEKRIMAELEAEQRIADAKAKKAREALAAEQKLNEARTKQARDANAQAIKDEEALRKIESDRIRARMEADAKAAAAKAAAQAKEAKRAQAEADKLARDIDKTSREATVAARRAKNELDRHIALTEQRNARMRADEIKAEKDIQKVRTQEWERTAGTFARTFRSEMKKASESISKDASGSLGGLRREMERLSTLQVGVGLDISEADAAKAAERVHAGLRKALRSRRLNAGELIDVSSAERGLRGFVREAGKAHRAAGLLGRGMRGLGQDGVQAANSFRVFNPFLIAVVGVLSVMPALTSAAGGGLLALGTSGLVASTGIAALAFGFSGLGDAMTALQNQADASGKEMKDQGNAAKQASYAVSDARKALADAERNAAQAAEDAARRVSDARKAAADSIENALDRQRDAQEAYADSIQSVREAEIALQEARKQAREDAKDLDFSIRANKLAVEEGLLTEFNAKVVYDSTRADGSATNAEIEQARIDWEQAKLGQERLREEGKRLAEEKEKWDKDGVEGSDVVKSAQDRLTDSIKAQKEAVQDLGEASREVDRARAEGAEAVADALRDQGRVSADNARSVAGAQESLRRAQESLTSASAEASATATAAEIAMGKLGNAGRNFAIFMMGVRGQFRDLRNDIQDVFLPDVQDAFSAIIEKNGPGFRAFMLSMAAVMGAFFTDLAESVNGPEMQAFFGAFADIGPNIQGNLNDSLISFLEALAGIFRASLPFTLAFTEALADLMERFSEWANSTGGQKAITDFLENTAEIGPQVLDFFGDLATFMFHFGQAMMPISLAILEGLGDFLQFLARQDPAILQAIGAGLLAVFGFVQIVSGIGALLAGLALLGGPLTIAIAAALALAGAFVYLWTTSETFRDKTRAVIGFIQEQFSDKIWGPIQEPLDKLGAAFTRLWEEVLEPFVNDHLAPALKWLGENVVPVIFAAIGTIIGTTFTVIAWWIENIVVPGFKVMGAIINWLWTWVVKPVFGFIAGAWNVMVDAFQWAWENILKPLFQAFALQLEIAWLAIKATWKKFGQPAVDVIVDSLRTLAKFFKWAWDKWGKPAFDAIYPFTLKPLVTAFKTTVDLIKDHWSGLKAALAAPILVGFKIVNSLIDGLNYIGKSVGAKTKIDNVSAPGWLQAMGGGSKPKKGADDRRTADGFAAGGVLPGYTPGRDVHDFYSPTAGRLHLSGGEAIMVPEWTKAMGSDWVRNMNALARSGGANAVRRAMMGGQAFARGGVFWPLPGGVASTYSGHDGVDLNSPNDYGKPYYAAVGGRIVYVGSGRGYGDAVFQATKYGTLVYGHSSAIGVRAGQTVRPGQMLGRVGNTGNSTGPHLHFGFPGGTYGQAMALLQGAAKAGYGPASPMAEAGGTIPKIISSILGNPLKIVKSWAKEGLEELASKFDSPFSKIVAEMPKVMFDAVADKATDMIPGWMKDVASLSPLGSLIGLLGGTANGSVKEQARKALGEGGFGSWASGKQWSALEALVQKESSWNPNAKNPTSTAEGLFQFLAATRATYGIKSGASVYDQTLAGAQYIKDRYGNPSKALAFHNANNWYSDGGVYQAGDTTASPGSSLPYNGTMQYDAGGILPTGLTTVVNLTGKPERIFTDSQFEAMKGGGGGFSPTYSPTFNASDLTAEDVAGDMEFAFRKMGRQGKYAGVGR